MKLSCLIAIVLGSYSIATAQVKISQVGKTEIPSSIKYLGHVINAAKYSDKTGIYLIITTETGQRKSAGNDDDYRDADLFAYNYKIEDSHYELTWQIHDFVKECPVDIEANYIPKSFAITDLDNNDIAEIWVMYKTVCHGDVSPSNMKVIMHQGDKKFAIRGHNKIMVAGQNYGGGDYVFDDAFKNGPTIFMKYADELWRKFMISKF